MRNSPFRIILVIVVFVLAATCLFYGIVHRDKDNSLKNRKYTAEFNKTEKTYISENPTMKLYIGGNLSYLAEKDEAAFIEDYMSYLMSPSGLDVSICRDKDDAGCFLYVVTKRLRAMSDEINFTAPILQVEGKLYAKKDIDTGDGNTLSGVAVSERLSDSELGGIECGGAKVKWQTVADEREAVEFARENDVDCILGDESAIDYYLGESNDYYGVKSDLYRYNVCIVTEKENTTLTEIINQCAHSMDRKQLSYLMSEKWLDGEGPVYMRTDYGDIYTLIFIIFIAVFVAFFIYYQSNKNLYWELSDRMNKLTESKRELETTFGNIGHCLAELSLEGNIMNINSAFYDFTGGNISNRKVWDVIGLDDANRKVLEDAVLNIDKKGPLRSMEVNAHHRTMTIDVYPIDNAFGSIEKLLFLAKDITNERMAEQQMLQDNKMIAVGQLAAGVAHEIRNPLGIIRNYCYVMKNMDDEDLRKKAVGQIEKAVDTSGAIIDSLLNFSRVSSKTERTIDVENHIDSLILLNNSNLKAKSISVKIICEKPVKATVVAESFDMILINLIANATDAMSQKGTLTIKIEKFDYYFEVSVIDTGSGIAEEELKDIFNPFFTTKGGSGGTGLGLYIVYNELSKMNGDIEVKSEVGVGSEFKVTLPIGNDRTNDKKTDEA